MNNLFGTIGLRSPSSWDLLESHNEPQSPPPLRSYRSTELLSNRNAYLLDRVSLTYAPSTPSVDCVSSEEKRANEHSVPSVRGEPEFDEFFMCLQRKLQMQLGDGGYQSMRMSDAGYKSMRLPCKQSRPSIGRLNENCTIVIISVINHF